MLTEMKIMSSTAHDAFSTRFRILAGLWTLGACTRRGILPTTCIWRRIYEGRELEYEGGSFKIAPLLILLMSSGSRRLGFQVCHYLVCLTFRLRDSRRLRSSLMASFEGKASDSAVKFDSRCNEAHLRSAANAASARDARR